MTGAADGGARPGPRADCAVDAAGRLTVAFDLPGAAEPALLLRLRPRKGREDEPETLVTVPLAGGGPGGRSRAVLVPGGPVLAEGRWDLYAVDRAEGHPGARRRLLPGVRDLRALLDGGGPVPERFPLAVRVPYPTKDNHLAVRAWLRPAHAEAGALDVSDTALTVRARLLGARLGEGAAAVVRRRGRNSVVREAAVRDEGGGALSFTVPFRELAGARGAEHDYWDMFVRPETGGPRVRVGRLLDDVADKKQIFTFPATVLDGVTVRPYYTVDNDLSVDVTSGAAG